MYRYGIATLLEDCPVGYEFNKNNTPLHLTHVDSFVINLNAYDLANKLGDQLLGIKSFKVRALKDEFYGPDKNIPVTIIELNKPLKRLHNLILDFLKNADATLKNPHFHSDGFSPHVSIYGSRRVQIGDEIQINHIAIGAKLSDDEDALHRILATIPLENL